MKKSQLAIRAFGVLASLWAVYKIFLVVAAQPDNASALEKVFVSSDILNTLFQTGLLAVWPILALISFILPARFVKLILALSWSAGLQMAVNYVPAIMSIGLFYLPVTFLSFAMGGIFYRKLSKPRPDWLWLLVVTIFSWTLSKALFKFATPLAIDRQLLLGILVLVIVILIRLRPMQAWVLAVLAITIILPIAVSSYKSYQAKNNRDFELIAKQIIFWHQDSNSKELTRFFVEDGRSIFKSGDDFNGYIRHHKVGVWSVSWEIVKNGKQDGGGFFVADNPSQTTGIILMTPPYNHRDAVVD